MCISVERTRTEKRETVEIMRCANTNEGGYAAPIFSERERERESESVRPFSTYNNPPTEPPPTHYPKELTKKDN